MSFTRLTIPLPTLSPAAKATFENGRPSHYLMLRIQVPEIRRGTESIRAFWYACRDVLSELQTRSAAVRGGATSSGFPEARTYEPWEGHFLYEFWWCNDDYRQPAESAWDVPALVSAIDFDWLGTRLRELVIDYGGAL